MATSVLNNFASGCSSPKASVRSPFGECAIDLVHLSRQTLGDRTLEVELLRLFDRQCAQIVAKLETIGVSETGIRHDLAHTLKGSARAVGANAVAAAAELYETELDQSSGKSASSGPFLDELRARVAEARRDVLRLLGAL